jgi:hypothetical protein
MLMMIFHAWSAVLLLALFLQVTSAYRSTSLSTRIKCTSGRNLGHISAIKYLRSSGYIVSSRNYASADDVSESAGAATSKSTSSKDVEVKAAKKSPSIKIDPLRFVFFNLLAIVIALGANFLGSTSFLLSTIKSPVWEQLQLDEVYPINGFRRHFDKEDGYNFKYPANWFIDRAILLADIRDRETPIGVLRQRPRAMRPDVAYQPKLDQRATLEDIANGPENISVIKSQVLDGFSLTETLGDPREAAIKLLKNFIAPESAGKSFELLDARSETRNGKLVYSFEYVVSKPDDPRFRVHSISVIINRDNKLFTFTAIAPEEKWNAVDKALLLESARSFTLQ